MYLRIVFSCLLIHYIKHPCTTKFSTTELPEDFTFNENKFVQNLWTFYNDILDTSNIDNFHSVEGIGITIAYEYNPTSLDKLLWKSTYLFVVRSIRERPSCMNVLDKPSPALGLDWIYNFFHKWKKKQNTF